LISNQLLDALCLGGRTKGMARKRTAGLGAASVPKRGKAAATEARLGALQGFVGFNLRIAQDASFRAFARESGSGNIRPGRFAALMVLRDNPGITQSALGRAIARDKSTVTPLLQGLQREGLIRRERSSTDRRSVTLRLTAAGEAALRGLVRHARRHDRRLDAIVGSAKPEFLALLRKIANGLG
jgi:DNA-binding MarR family transcriptional regulator